MGLPIDKREQWPVVCTALSYAHLPFYEQLPCSVLRACTICRRIDELRRGKGRANVLRAGPCSTSSHELVTTRGRTIPKPAAFVSKHIRFG